MVDHSCLLEVLSCLVGHCTLMLFLLFHWLTFILWPLDLGVLQGLLLKLLYSHSFGDLTLFHGFKSYIYCHTSKFSPSLLKFRQIYWKLRSGHLHLLSIKHLKLNMFKTEFLAYFLVDQAQTRASRTTPHGLSLSTSRQSKILLALPSKYI